MHRVHHRYTVQHVYLLSSHSQFHVISSHFLDCFLHLQQLQLELGSLYCLAMPQGDLSGSATLPICCVICTNYLFSSVRIKFKLALLAFSARSNSAPLYLSCLLHNYVPGRSLRSSQSNLLCVPSYKLNFGACSFRVATSTVWNSLPADIRAC